MKAQKHIIYQIYVIISSCLTHKMLVWIRKPVVFTVCCHDGEPTVRLTSISGLEPVSLDSGFT